MKKYSTIF